MPTVLDLNSSPSWQH